MTFWTDRRVLVTGGAGFIGHRLVAKLVELGSNVRVIDDLSKGTEKNLGDLVNRIEFRNVDLLDPQVAVDVLKDVDVCFHLAARIGGIAYFHKTPATSLRDNAIMNLNLWDAAKESHAKMVCLSSSMVFERATIYPTPESALTATPPPKSGYGFSKLLAEYVAKTYHEQFGVNYLIVRPFNAYGPGEIPGDYVGYAHVIPDLIKKTLSGQYPLEILGSGTQTRSYTYVDDIANAVVHLTERYDNDNFNIGTGIETSVSDLAEKIWVLCDRKESYAARKLPGFEYDVERRVPDLSKILATGWKPQVDLDSGLKKTISWVRMQVV